MKKIFKIILIAELIILSIFFIGYFIFEYDYEKANQVNICSNETFYNISENLVG